MRWGKVDYKQLKDLQKKLDTLEKGTNRVYQGCAEKCAKEIAGTFLKTVIHKTPKGDYRREITVTAKRDSKKHKKGEKYIKKVNTSGKQGGTLRKGWTISSMKKVGNSYIIEVINPVHYASYVESGHRTRNHKGFVKGRRFLRDSETEVQEQAPKIVKRAVEKHLRSIFGK